ncbi:MAG TPA: hypothetical protein VHE30_12485 [Polyangiaceae bacterium]|nr:hypothetical protein [Polyangiaceae bacterium]
MTTRSVAIAVGRETLEGDLTLPAGARGVVLFAHGSGSSRGSPRNRSVAKRLSDAGLGTLLFDLLTRAEERMDAIDGHLRFDIPFLARRLGVATDFVRDSELTRSLRCGYFGASTGAAAALVAAAARPGEIFAVVSRGGRPDLAEGSLSRVRAPTLLIVGEEDREVLELNRIALSELSCPRELAIVAGATHLFEEPGTLDEAARLARDWFLRHVEENGAP